MALAGELERATSDLSDLPEPLPSTAARPPSEVLDALRREER
jgi:hypothetical protein